jgi:DNA-binding transcriptional ArsR family regulator
MTDKASFIDPDGTYWILDREQIDALASPRRHDIVDRLVASGPLSIKELAGMVGAEPPALYHHVRKLLKLGLVVEAGHRVVRRKREQLYAAPAKRMRLSRALDDPANRDVFIQMFSALSRQMARDYRRGALSPAARTHGEDKNLGFAHQIGRPSPRQLAMINRRLEEIAEILWDSPGKGEGLIGISWVVAPIPATVTAGEEADEAEG